jgi:hypothetical protein
MGDLPGRAGQQDRRVGVVEATGERDSLAPQQCRDDLEGLGEPRHPVVGRIPERHVLGVVPARA